MSSNHAAPLSECELLRAYLADVCADDADLLATVAALADAGEAELLRLIRDFRDNVSNAELLRRFGPPTALDERLRVIHRIYVDQARHVREQTERPARARKCYEARMLARRDNYQAMLEDAGAAIPTDDRQRYERLVHCAREKVPYDALPERLGCDALAVEAEVLQLRQRFKEWSARHGSGRTRPPPEVCDG